ncbi:ribonuclease M5, partial [Xanthomonas citri pv. citri]|nr:ribonuclease M5 [Xanthomonas citri pv. citri]
QMFQIKKSDFMSALDTVMREEQNE